MDAINKTDSAVVKYALIVAGGKGVRMGGSVPKQYLLVHQKPVLYYALRAFLDAFEDMHLIIVHGEKDEKLMRAVLDYLPGTRALLVPGGDTRFHSVQNGLAAVTGESVIFVHDGVRPLVSPGLIRTCYRQALEKGNAVPSLELRESIRLVRGEKSYAQDRTSFQCTQTPQTFLSGVLLPAFRQAYDPGFTDEASVVEKAGGAIHLIRGEEQNIKITRPVDLLIVEQLLKNNG